jgi:hypothetical protein
LAERLTRLIRSFSALRRRRLWKGAVTGSVSAIEITRGRGRDHWHVHAHVLVTGSYISQAALSAAWHEETGDSHIVDVREVTDLQRGVGYVVKYASKGLDGSVVADPDALLEAVTALKGRRLLLVCGVWKALASAKLPSRFTDWQRIGSYDSVLDASVRGDRQAVEAVVSLSLGSDLRGEESQGWLRHAPPRPVEGVIHLFDGGREGG